MSVRLFKCTSTSSTTSTALLLSASSITCYKFLWPGVGQIFYCLTGDWRAAARQKPSISKEEEVDKPMGNSNINYIEYVRSSGCVGVILSYELFRRFSPPHRLCTVYSTLPTLMTRWGKFPPFMFLHGVSQRTCTVR